MKILKSIKNLRSGLYTASDQQAYHDLIGWWFNPLSICATIAILVLTKPLWLIALLAFLWLIK